MSAAEPPEVGPPPGPARVNRRRVLLGAVGLLAAAGIGTGLGAAVTRARDDEPAPITDPGLTGTGGTLWIPPLAAATRVDGRLTFDLVAQEGRTSILPGTTTDTWGFGTSILGPTLRARRGDEVTVRVRNRLPEPTTVHWHGMRLPADADGGPHQLVEPGDSWSPTWRIDQPAATLWYHPHPHEQTGPHVYRGLAGMFLLDDEEESALALPREYGIDDIPLVVQDKTFDGQARLIGGRRGFGHLHDTVVVNGRNDPTFTVLAERTRFRIVNASSSRTYSFGLSDGRSFDAIASDGGLLAEPVALRRVLLTPGERAEIVVTMSAGDELSLRSYPHDVTDAAEISGSGEELQILRLAAAASLRPSPPLPRRLAAGLGAPDVAAAVATRPFVLGVTGINDKVMDMDRVDETVTSGSTEIWELRVTNNGTHNLHVHGVQFRILDIDGDAPPPELAGWKDTVHLPYERRVRVLVPFPRFSDPATPYMYHCHVLWHEDLGMMGQFLLVDAAAGTGVPVALHRHG